MLKQAAVALLGMTAAVLVLLLPRAGVYAQSPSPLPSTGFCKAFVNPAQYKCTEELVQTEDGYLLAVQRISPSPRPTKARGPAFLYHGIMQGGETWVLNSNEESLAFMMANSGYDVWIGNSRSSKYTYGHTKHTRKDKEFWNWTWDDLVETDFPAMLQHVYDRSKQKIYYVGYSQGSMTALASFSEGDTVKLVSKAALLAPIGSLGHITSPIASAASHLFVDEILLLAGVTEFNAYSDAGQKFTDAICTSNKVNCKHEFMSQITGANCCFNSSQIDFYEKHSLQSTSMKNIAHMAQSMRKGGLYKRRILNSLSKPSLMVRSGKFSMYDHGFNNIKRYHSLFPLEYDVSAIPAKLPMLLVHGSKDALADPIDVANLIENLKGTPKVINLPKYAHADFVMGTKASADVYVPIIAFFKA